MSDQPITHTALHVSIVEAENIPAHRDCPPGVYAITVSTGDNYLTLTTEGHIDGSPEAIAEAAVAAIAKDPDFWGAHVALGVATLALRHECERG